MALEDKIEKNPAEGSLDETAAQQQAEQTPQAGGEAADLQKKKRRRRKKTAAARRASAAAAEAAENQEKEDGGDPVADAPAAEARPDAEPDAESAPAPEAPKTPEPQAEEPAAPQDAPAGETADQPEEPAAEAPGGEQPAEEQPAEEQPAEDQSAEDQPAETQAAEESAAESAEEPAGAAAEQEQTPPAPEEPAEPEPTPEQLRRNAELTRTVQISIEKLMEMQAAQTPPAEPTPAEPEPAPPTLEDHIRSGLGRMARWLLLVAAFVAVVAGLGIAMLYSAATPEAIPQVSVAFNGETMETAEARWQVPVVGDSFKRTYAEKGSKEPVEISTVESAKATLQVIAEDCDTYFTITDANEQVVFEGTAEQFEAFRFTENGAYTAELEVTRRGAGLSHESAVSGREVYRFCFDVHLRPSIRLNNSSVRQGGVVAVRVTGLPGLQAPVMTTELPATEFFEGESGWIAYLPIGIDQEAGEYVLHIEADGYAQDLRLIVMQHLEQFKDVYSTSQLTWPYISVEDTPAQVQAVLAETEAEPAWVKDGFVQPFTDSINVTLGYGTTEYVNRTRAEREAGTGSGRTSTNTLVKTRYGGQLIAPADGRVVLAQDLGGVAGNTLVIDHGAGVKSIFYGLGTLNVQAGAQVIRGQQVAVTNLITISEVRIGATPVEPLAVWRGQCNALRYY